MPSVAPSTRRASSTSRSTESPPGALAASPEDAEAAARQGERHVRVALHGARAEVHDWVAGEPGAYRRAIATLTTGRSLGLQLAVYTSLTRSNARVLPELPRLLRARAVRGWVVALPETLDTAIHPRLGMAMPSALAALAQAHTLGLDARVLGAPWCVLGTLRGLAAPSKPREYGARCEGCAARERCPGVTPDYLARFGEGELRRLG